jgi:hypothetical protein
MNPSFWRWFYHRVNPNHTPSLISVATTSTCCSRSDDLVSLIGSVITGSCPPPLAPPDALLLVTSFGAESYLFPFFCMGATPLPPLPLSSSARPSIPKNRACSLCRFGWRSGRATRRCGCHMKSLDPVAYRISTGRICLVVAPALEVRRGNRSARRAVWWFLA